MTFVLLASLFAGIFGLRDASAFGLKAFFKSVFFNGGATAINNITSGNKLHKGSLFLTAVPNIDPQAARGGARLQIVDGAALISVVGPLGNIAEAEELSQTYKITTYTVRDGENLSLIAQSFGVNVATIRWANGIPQGGIIRPGQVLVILPITGVRHVVKKGDTLASIAKKYGGDLKEIIDSNDLRETDGLKPGSVVIIPDGEMPVAEQPRLSPKRRHVRGGGPYLPGYFMRPIDGGRKSQGIHGFNAVDLAVACGTPLKASASGEVITARRGGWNGGYGKYVAISHPNGTQTVYGHMSKVDVERGWHVAKGQRIGAVGTTGNSTGCHVHFEIRGAKNPF